MDVNFGRSREFSIGIEEEFQILHGETFDLASRIGEVLEATGDDPRIKPELMQSVVEVATHVANDVPSAIAEARELRARLRDAASDSGSLVASAGTHPFARVRHQQITDEERYERLHDEMQWVAEQELIFGLHVHVGLETAEKAIAVANALRTHLPELLALSANSPYWQGEETGLASTRIKLFDAFPRSGLPPAFASFEEWEALIERGVRTGSFEDYSYIWWDLRPHPRLGTIEVRICDGQTRVESLAGIVALVQCLVAALGERYDRKGALPVEPTMLIDENRWRAARRGLDAELIWLERDEVRPAREAVRALVETADPAARRLGCTEELAAVDRICERGTGADEQRRVRAERGSLLAVAQWLAEETTSGL